MRTFPVFVVALLSQGILPGRFKVHGGTVEEHPIDWCGQQPDHLLGRGCVEWFNARRIQLRHHPIDFLYRQVVG